MQQAQHEMLRAQQESISDLKKMMTLLLEKSKKAPKTPKVDWVSYAALDQTAANHLDLTMNQQLVLFFFNRSNTCEFHQI